MRFGSCVNSRHKLLVNSLQNEVALGMQKSAHVNKSSRQTSSSCHLAAF